MLNPKVEIIDRVGIGCSFSYILAISEEGLLHRDARSPQRFLPVQSYINMNPLPLLT